ncbi:MAG TPA: alpha/beta hydrolase [Candidatus Binatia bacterium]|nr:alpha/beta hydrolase [Candidatus Binatia bacterium]
MRAAVDGRRLFFDVDGAKLVPDGPSMREKPTLLVLHGGPGFDHSMMKPWFAPLADVAQVVYLDHVGNGRSDRPPAPELTLDRWGDDVRAFCDALEIEAPVVFGVSFGGFVAQAYATRHPEHPRGLVLCNTAARHRDDTTLAAFERLGGGEARAAAAAFFDRPSSETLIEYARVCTPVYNRRPQDPDVLTRSLAVANFDLMIDFFAGEFRRFDFRAALSRVRCPTLVVIGEDDPITPPADGDEMAACLPPALARVERFAGCGHPVYQDEEAGFATALRSFLSSL